MELRRKRGVATYLTFPIVDSSGVNVTGLSPIRPQYATFTDSTEPNTKFSTISNATCTEISGTGWYYASLTATEMANDYIVFIASPTTGSGRQVRLLLNCTAVASVTQVQNPVPLLWSSITDSGSSVSLSGTRFASVSNPVPLLWSSITNPTATTPRVDVWAWIGVVPSALSNQKVQCDISAIANDSAAAENLQDFFNTTGYAATYSSVGTTTHVEDLTVTAYPEPSAVPAASTTLKNKLNWLTLLGRNKITISSVTQVAWDDAGTATVSFATHSDSAGLFTRNEWS